MTTISFREIDGLIAEVLISGHSHFSQLGTDIVCAGISSVVEGATSFFSQEKYQKLVSVSSRSAKVSFLVKNTGDLQLQSCLRMMIHQLENLAHFFPSYVSVKEISKLH